MNGIGRALGLAVVLALPVGQPVASAETPAAMRVILENMRELLRLGASQIEFEDSLNALRILAAARGIEDQASELREHMEAGGASGFLAATLERYAFLLARSYELGDEQAARRLVFRMTDICIACHTRLPSPADSPLAADFLDEEAMRALAPRERATIQIATRRFEDGLQTLRAVLGQPFADEDRTRQALLAYLVVSLRVKSDVARVLESLESLAARDDFPPSLRADMAAWRDVLLTSRLEMPPAEVVEVAEAHIRNGERWDELASGTGLIDFILASSLLHQHLEREDVSAGERSHANYLLGAAEYRISAGHWLPQTELYLELAIVSSPASESAKLAFDFLRERVREAYGTEVPPEVSEHLRYLEGLMEGGG